MKVWICYVIIVNAAACFLYGLDKWKARRGAWRISEKTLFVTAFAGGSLGALLAMLLFRHKTKKAGFAVGIPVLFIVHCILIVCYGMYVR